MRSLSYFVVGLLLFSSFAAASIGKDAGVERKIINSDFLELNAVETSDVKTIELSFSEPDVTEISIDEETYVRLDVEGANTVLYRAGEPMLPIYTTTLSFPFGTRILDVECDMQEVDSMVLSHKIVPVPPPIPVNMEKNSVELTMDEVVYNSEELYPNEWFNYRTMGGLDENNERKTFLTVRVYSVRYISAADTINYISGDAILTIKYQEPASPITFGNGYDMVIIAPSVFSGRLQKLVDHKDDMGIETKLVTTGDIYSGYDGRDRPEKIKYFIKDAIEDWGITYVLLVGGMKSLLFGDWGMHSDLLWYVPVRYSNLVDGYPEYSYITDLYYADIYDGEGNFDDWDSNGNGVFAEWPGMWPKDILDLMPDVYVGRLACRNIVEVEIMMNKIINYEKSYSYDTPWFKNMILIGGDSFDDTPYGTNYFEGEVTNQKAFDYMPGFTAVKLWTSLGTLTGPDDVITEQSEGSGFTYFSGHGNPFSWATHPPNDYNTWIQGLTIMDMPSLSNREKIPVCIVGGCHNSEFNVSLFSTLLKRNYWTYGVPTPECWSWWLTRKVGGGSIATIGNTGLGYGAVGDGDGDGIPDCIEAYGGYIETQFFNATGQYNVDILGDAWGWAVRDYIETLGGMGSGEKIHCKTVQEWPLLGDPSLKIGGYPSGSGLKAKIVDAVSGVMGSPGKPIYFQASAFDGAPPYTYRWDLDYDGDYDDATGRIVTKTWYLPGVYWIGLKVTDSNNNVDIFETIVQIEYVAPNTPDTPDGPAEIETGEGYTYTTSATHPYGEQIYYVFGWGDGTFSWRGPHASGATVSASHSWNKEGDYEIKVIAVDPHAKMSRWSDPLEVTISEGNNNQNSQSQQRSSQSNPQNNPQSNPQSNPSSSSQRSTNLLFFQILEQLLPGLR